MSRQFSRRFLARLILPPWRQRWCVPPKRRFTFNRLHGIVFHAVGTWDLVQSIYYVSVTDFIVGAPYEESGTGVIYIYHGGKQGPKREVSQRIIGSEVHPQILGFGISFSRSLDVDGNHYPGKSKAERKVVLRSRHNWHLVAGFPPRRPEFDPRSNHWDL
jgi:hypothetical protein